MATKQLKGFGWFVCGVLVAPPCYLVTSWVAAERARVEALDRSIAAAHRDIRDLETEFQTRANLAQLEKWNGDVLALAAPRPDQYVAGEEALAQLHFAPAGEGAVKPASYIVPAGYADNRAPDPAPVQQVAAVKPEAAPTTKAAPATRAAPVTLAAVAAPSPSRALPTPTKAPAAPAKPAAAPVKKPQAVAMLDRTLLSDRTLGDLSRGAKAEAVRKR